VIDWWHWHNEPYLVGGLVVLGWFHALLFGPLRAKVAPGAPRERARAVRFYAALILFYLAVGSPLDQVGEQFLFSAHMAQHLILTYIAAPLFLAGMPDWMVDGAARRSRLGGLLRWITRPVPAVLLYAVITGVWHLPALYDWALRDKTVHVIEHLCFFAAGVLLWWPLFADSRTAPRIAHGPQILYMLGMMVANTPLFAYITFSRAVLYPTYEFAPRITALTAHEDQVLAGVMMKLVGVAVAIGMAGWSFWCWNAESEAATPGTPPRP
jgi:putative membrane protein